MKTLVGEIKLVKLLSNVSVTETTNGSAIDSRVANSLLFDTALITANVGAITGTPDSVTITIQESDSSTFASGNTTAEGGDAQTVVANGQYVWQVRRTKRYLRAVVTVTGGSTPTALIAVEGLLTNWATPFPII